VKTVIYLLFAAILLQANDFNASVLNSAYVSSWDNVNETLQRFIIKHDNKIKEKYFPLVDQPVLIENSYEGKAEPQTPKPAYTRDDLKILMTYTKYLIDQNRTQEIPEIYTRVISGLNNTDNNAYVTTFKIAMGNITLKSLKHDLDYLTPKEKSELLTHIPGLLRCKIEDFDAAVYDLFKTDIELAQSSLAQKFPKKRASRIVSILEKKVFDFYYHLFALKNVETQKSFMAKAIKEKNDFSKKLSRQLRKQPLSGDAIQKLSDETIADTLFYSAFLTDFIGSREACKKVIKRNQKVLQMLK